MVDRSIIEEIIISKCSNREVKSKLSKLTDEEKYDKLSDKLNNAELDHYNYLKNELDTISKTLEEYEEFKKEKNTTVFDNFIKNFKEKRKNLEDLLFQYEKRIINGNNNKSDNNNVNVDEKKYQSDRNTRSDSNFDVQLGKLEKEQIQLQQDTNFSAENYSGLIKYFHDGSSMLNSKLNNGNSWNELSANEKEHKSLKLNEIDNYLSDAIDRSPGLKYDTVLYHRGVFDVKKMTGDKIKFKGYTSASFQEQVANDWSENFNNKGMPMYTYRILAPKGTKGFCANDDKFMNLTSHREEHEYLLGKGMEATVVDVDPSTHTVTIVLD